jgi:hypothetical protein
MLQTFHFLYITLSVQSDFSAPQFAVLFFAQISPQATFCAAHNVTKPATSQEGPVLP